ncbi:hypothetical protein Q667_12595 [Marinobacter sp. C1S70]|jgi:hypothetical protein|uniref:hypothetical protein n=1 Tax=Marinobacter sp. C1S70 TaxID=1396859 RepID=UPI0003B8A27A|nr:hypothetical protein [Marinobacter sp. C1S70]ERS89326.1 hypothetical protein Q667_12595 [Marinobacter sp. C1S70]
MAQMHEKQTFQELASLLGLIAPEDWVSLLSIYLFHDGAMKLKHYVKEGPRSNWRTLNTGSVGFDIMDWWQNYHGLVKEAEGSEFKFAKAQIDPSGNLKMRLSYEAVDPLSDIDVLRIAENLSENS